MILVGNKTFDDIYVTANTSAQQLMSKEKQKLGKVIT